MSRVRRPRPGLPFRSDGVAAAWRRLHLPYYEEARRYFDEAQADGTLDGVNEIELYRERTLHDLVSTYGDGS